MPEKTYKLFVFILIILLAACAQQPPKDAIGLTDPYFGLTPSDAPAILIPQIISTQLIEYNGTFSPDGDQFYYTSGIAGKSIITYVERDTQTNQWSSPKVAAFSGQYTEYDPLFSPDGHRLYFSSERPTSSSSNTNTNVWYVEHVDLAWTNPTLVPLTGKGDYYSSLTADGTIYYNVWNTGKILKANKSDTGYVSQVLSKSINGASDVGDPFIAPDESYLIFRAYFDDGFGRGDLYISYNINDSWTKPINLGEGINSNAHEICPFVTTDGKLFIFSSDRVFHRPRFESNAGVHELIEKHQSYDNGNMNIYFVSTRFITRIKKRFADVE